MVRPAEPEREPDDVKLTFILKYNGVIELWLGEGMTAGEFAGLLRGIADEYASGRIEKIT